MNYADVKLDQVFVEVKDPKKPKRVQRKVQVVALRIYPATVRVREGRGTGHELETPLKRLTDPSQWGLR